MPEEEARVFSRWLPAKIPTEMAEKEAGIDRTANRGCQTRS
jgi:hypothetical protein